MITNTNGSLACKPLVASLQPQSVSYVVKGFVAIMFCPFKLL